MKFNMMLRTGNAYWASIKSVDLKPHIIGKTGGDLTEHGLVEPSQKAVAYTFDEAHNPATADLFRAVSPLCNDEVNRFAHLHQSPDDRD